MRKTSLKAFSLLFCFSCLFFFVGTDVVVVVVVVVIVVTDEVLHFRMLGKYVSLVAYVFGA